MNTQETINVSGFAFTLREADLSDSSHPVTVEVGGLLESFDDRSTAMLWVLVMARALR